MQTESDAIDDVRPHAMEDLTTDFDGSDDSRKTFVEENDIGGTSSGVRSICDSDTTIGLLEGSRIVDTIYDEARSQRLAKSEVEGTQDLPPVIPTKCPRCLSISTT